MTFTSQAEKRRYEWAEKQRCLRDAAPEMLAALKECLDWIESNFELPSGNFENPDLTQVVKGARDAITKAEGEVK